MEEKRRKDKLEKPINVTPINKPPEAKTEPEKSGAVDLDSVGIHA
jgi:hypothetical protein